MIRAILIGWSFGLIALCSSGAVEDRISRQVEFISVEANTGGSSGGHVALRIDNSVYHYMAGSFDSLLLLYRVPWEDFHARYCLLENRGLKVNQLALSGDATAQIEARLKILHAVQDKHVGRLDALEIERDWLSSLTGEEATPSLAGTGFFRRSSDKPDPDALALRGKVERELGDRFIEFGLARLNTALRRDALAVSTPGDSAIEVGRYPEVGEISAERLVDRLLLREALLTLKKAAGLDSAALRRPDDRPLSSKERSALTELAETLEGSVIRLLQSPRPDRGRPLVLASARYLAIRRSLDENRMVLLDNFSDKVEVLDPALTRRHSDLLRSLAEKTGESWRRTRGEVFSGGGKLDEFSYNSLEMAASRHAELVDAELHDKPVRIIGPLRRSPSRSAPVTPLDIAADPAQVAAAGERSGEVYLANKKAVQSIYGFSLLKHNCGTELTSAIRSAFPDDEAAAAALGGTIVPGAGLTIIPAALSGKVKRRWDVSDSGRVPSRRRADVERMVNEEGRPMLTRLREGNRLTSEAYPGSIEDHAFLFFSDGRIVLRPFQGVANFAYGLGHSGVGLVTLPFDKGRLAASGAKGMFWSLPELVGISIRKGQYDLLPEDWGGRTDAVEPSDDDSTR